MKTFLTITLFQIAISINAAPPASNTNLIKSHLHDINTAHHKTAALLVSNIFSGNSSTESVELSSNSQKQFANRLAESFSHKDLDDLSAMLKNQTIKEFHKLLLEHLESLNKNIELNADNVIKKTLFNQTPHPENKISYISNTKEQIVWMIENGYDTNTFDAYSDGRIEEKPEITKRRSDILSRAKWIISVEEGPYRGTWGSENEPKQFGNGIRFTIVGSKTEIIVNGKYSIRKIE